MAVIAFPTIGTHFPTVGIPSTHRQAVLFPTVWRSEYGSDAIIPSTETVYLVDKDGNLLLDNNGNYLTVPEPLH